MGQRPTKPTALKVLEGNRGKRGIPGKEPQPKAIVPDMPKTIDDDAKRTWKKLTPILKELGLVTEADGDMLAILCQLQARISQIHKEMKAANVAIKKMKRKYNEFFQADEIEKARDVAFLLGDVEGKKAALMKEERQYSALFKQYGAEFGLSPRGRTGLTITGADGESGEDFLT